MVRARTKHTADMLWLPPACVGPGPLWTNSQSSISGHWETLTDLEIFFGSRYGLTRHEISSMEQIWEDSANGRFDRRTRDRERVRSGVFLFPFSRAPTPNSGVFTISPLCFCGADASGDWSDDRFRTPCPRPDHLALHSSPGHKVLSPTVAFSVCPRYWSIFS